MTGRYPMRHGLQTLVIFPSHKYGLPTDEKTLPQALKEVGYQTAMVGKWHLGHADKKYWPQNRGFDHFYGNLVGEVDYFTKERGGIVDWQRNGTFLKEEGYYTDLIGNEAVSLIEHHDTSKPLFLYCGIARGPRPLPGSSGRNRRLQGRFPGRTAPDLRRDDHQDGHPCRPGDCRPGKEGDAREHDHLLHNRQRRAGQCRFFATGARSPEEREESGGVALDQKPPCSNAPFSGGKGGLKEGGVRLPAIVNWPAMLKPAVVNEPLHHVDVMPTLLAYVGGKGDPSKPFDGKDATATIAEGQPSPHEDILINVEVFRGAIRKGKWKFIKIAILPGKTELFDLEKDPGEQTNVADQIPGCREGPGSPAAGLREATEDEPLAQVAGRLTSASRARRCLPPSTAPTADCLTRSRFCRRTECTIPLQLGWELCS